MTMTPQQIDALPAGRELDALVLVHVMGWKWWKCKPPPHVSTDIAAAWTVVEEMAGHGNDVIIQHSRTEPGFWACEFNAGGVCDGPSLPLAICRAALNAVFAAKAQEEKCVSIK